MRAVSNGAVSELRYDGFDGLLCTGTALSHARRGTRLAHLIVRCHPTRPVDPTAVTLWDRVGGGNLLTADVRSVTTAAERQRIAGALHDKVSSALLAIAANLQRAAQRSPSFS